MKVVHVIAFILVVIGGLNWLVFALVSGWNLANYIGGDTVAKVVYILVGLSAIWLAATHAKDCKGCSGCVCAPSTPTTPQV